MIISERGTSPEGEMPAVQVGLDQKSTYINCSSKTNVCKPFDRDGKSSGALM